MKQNRMNVNTLFFIRLSRIKKNGLCPIFLRITTKGERVEMTIDQSVNPDVWNNSTGYATGNTKHAKLVNQTLQAIRYRISEITISLREEKKSLSAIRIKNLLMGIKEDEHFLMEIYKSHNDQMLNLIGKQFSPATYRKYQYAYQNTQDYLQDFHDIDDIEISDIDFQFISDYEYYLKSKRNCSHNTAVRYIKQMKKIVNIALNNDWLKEDPFKKYRVGYKKIDKDFLTEDELEKIINKSFTVKRIDQVRDCFLFSCFTGLAHVDLKNLTKDNIIIGVNGKQWLHIHRQKTNTSSKIPLLPIKQG